MKIIIAGAGEVGFHLAKLLSYEAQDITLIDTDKEKLSYADNHLDIRVLKGDATSIQVLKDAEVDDSDLVIGVTASETTNLTLCLLAKQLGCKRNVLCNSKAGRHWELIYDKTSNLPTSQYWYYDFYNHVEDGNRTRCH